MKSQAVQTFEHTPEFSSRRRALFPCDESSADNDFDCISPLSSDSNSDDEAGGFIRRKPLLLDDAVGDKYDIIGVVEQSIPQETAIDITPQNAKILQFDPPIHITSPLSADSGISLSEETPTQKLKTPNDTFINPKLPRLIRKTSVDLSVFNSECVEAFSPEGAIDIHSNHFKNSKVRTALFPEPDMSLPPRSFYPKPNASPPNCSVVARKPVIKPTSSHKKTRQSLSRRKGRKQFGQINAGVRHNIKKPKKSRRSNEAVMQAAINILENSPLNAFFNESEANQDLEPQMQSTFNSALIDEPPSPEPDPTKKFFKSSRHKAVTTVIDNVKIQVTNGKMSLIEPKNKLKRPKMDHSPGKFSKCPKVSGGTRNSENFSKCPEVSDENWNSENSSKRPKPSDDNHNSENASKRLKTTDENDFNFESTESLISNAQMNGIMSTLEDKENQSDPGANILLSPTSQMCDMTSGLAINSPKKAINLNPVLEKLASQPPKLFPVFYPGKVRMPEERNVHSPRNSKKFRPLSKDQMLLDAGQKGLRVTQCFECKFLYHMGDPSDEIIHLNYHNAVHILHFQGWKNERVVSNASLDGKIIHILPNDPKAWWKKIKDLLEVVNRDLGYFDIEFNIEHSQVFLYVKNKTIVGALVAEAKTKGHRMLTTQIGQVDFCSEESYPIKCGISRIWVSPNCRNKGIGTALVNSLKSNFAFASILKNEDIAFSSPTEMGKSFAKSYFKTPNFLIYCE